jgi:hypothetical protein
VIIPLSSYKDFGKEFGRRNIKIPKRKTIKPCPTSPYITPKRKGKVTKVTRVGFASL